MIVQKMNNPDKPVSPPALSVSFGSPAHFGKIESTRTLSFEALVEILTAAPWHAGNLALSEYQSLAAGSKADKQAAKADKATRWFSLATFSGRRHNKNVTSLSGFVGDLDQGTLTSEDVQAKLAGRVHLIYTSFSHCDDAPKFRLVIPYAAPVSAADHRRLFAWFNGPAMFDGALDTAASDEARLSYFPSHSADHADAAEYRYQRDGAYFDAAALLASLPPAPTKAVQSVELTTEAPWPVAIPDLSAAVAARRAEFPALGAMLDGPGVDSDHDFRVCCEILTLNGGNGQAALDYLRRIEYKWSPAKEGREDYYQPRTMLRAFDKLRTDPKVNVALAFRGDLPPAALSAPPVPGNIPSPPAPLAYEPTLVRASDIKPEAIDWVWLNWLALGKLHVIAGGKSDGKSTLLLKLGATITRGGAWPDGSRCDEPGYLVIWSGEDGVADTLVPRLSLMDADMSRVFILYGARLSDGTYAPFNPASDIARLDAQVAKLTGGPVFLMIDPILSVVAGDMHRANEVRTALKPTVDLAAKHQLVAVGVTHFTKGTKGSNPLERVLGSQAFAALARVVLVTAKDDQNSRRVLMRAGSNIGPSTGGFAYSMAIEPVPGLLDRKGKPVSHARIEWGDPIEGNAREILGEIEGSDEDKGSTHAECVELLRTRLSNADGSICQYPPSSDIIKNELKAAGYSAWTIRKACKSLGILYEKQQSGTTYWRLPERPLGPTKAPPLTLPTVKVPRESPK